MTKTKSKSQDETDVEKLELADQLTPTEIASAKAGKHMRDKAKRLSQEEEDAAADMPADETWDPKQLEHQEEHKEITYDQAMAVLVKCHQEALDALGGDPHKSVDVEKRYVLGIAPHDTKKGLITESVLARYGYAAEISQQHPTTIVDPMEPRKRLGQAWEQVDIEPNIDAWQKGEKARWARGGPILPEQNDFTRVQTLKNVMETARIVQETFNKLPAHLRRAAADSPVRFEEMLASEAGLKALANKGLQEAMAPWRGQAEPVTVLIPTEYNKD